MNNAARGDVVVTAGNPVFVRYLVYHTPAHIVDLNSSQQEDVERSLVSAERIFILNDVFDYPPSMKVRFPSNAKQVARYAVELKPNSRRLLDNEFGGIWELVREDTK